MGCKDVPALTPRACEYVKEVGLQMGSRATDEVEVANRMTVK